MPEPTPQITYSPEGILELRKTFDEETKDRSAAFSAHIEQLDSLPGYDVIEGNLGTVVSVEVGEVLHDTGEPNLQSQSAETLINNLKVFTDFVGYEDSDEHVFSLDVWHNSGAVGVIFPQFQRWLNAVLNEDTARTCINSMAYPFGSAARKQAEKDFSYRTDGESAAAGLGGFTFGVISRREKFGISTYDETDEEPIHKEGEVAWNWVDLSTIGSCACWGVIGEERERVYIGPESSRLYEMSPHNIDFATQSLSLVLGAATLAYEAARYPGREDILASAEWAEPRR